MSGWQAEIQAQRGALRLDVQIGGAAEGVVALIGPNGSGKTSVLRALAGALVLERAEIEVGGAIWASSQRGLEMPMEHRQVGYVPQGHALFGHLDVLDNVAFGLSFGPNKLARRVRHLKAQRQLEELGCGELASRRVADLSGGEAQRVALARALVLEPALLLLDEPLSALDAGARREVRALLASHLTALARPALMVTHDVRDVASLSTMVYVLDAGRVVQRGTLEALRAEPGSDFVAEFVGL